MDTIPASRVSGRDIIAAIKRAGVRFVVALPDRTTTENVLKPLLRDPEIKVVQVCKEDEGLSICAGLHAASQRSVMMMQYTGLLDSVNALRGVAVELRNPIVMIVGMLYKEPGVAPKDSSKWPVRILEPLMELMKIEHHLVEADGDAARIAGIIEGAYERSAPAVIFIGAEPRQ
jgi:sulfopyruvate decarboxylase TPP-binding subunit